MKLWVAWWVHDCKWETPSGHCGLATDCRELCRLECWHFLTFIWVFLQDTIWIHVSFCLWHWSRQPWSICSSLERCLAWNTGMCHAESSQQLGKWLNGSTSWFRGARCQISLDTMPWVISSLRNLDSKRQHVGIWAVRVHFTVWIQSSEVWNGSKSRV